MGQRLFVLKYYCFQLEYNDCETPETCEYTRTFSTRNQVLIKKPQTLKLQPPHRPIKRPDTMGKIRARGPS